jgi:hypothetical protein
LALLVVLGGASAVAYYLGFVKPYLMSEYYQQPLLDLAKINGASVPSANAWALTWIALFACYYIAFRLCPPVDASSKRFRRIGLGVVVGWAIVSSVTLVFMYPVGAADLFDYIFRGRMITEYGLNPFTNVPTAVSTDPLFPYIAWKSEPSHYGPLWEGLAAIGSLLGGSSLWNNMLVYKAIVIVANVANIGLTYAILRTVKPSWALKGALFYAWNPVVLFEVAGNGHHESLVATFMLLAVYCFVTMRRWAVVPSIVLGGLTKFVPLAMGLPAVAALWQDRVRRTPRRGDYDAEEADRPPLANREVLTLLGINVLISGALTVVLYLPFWQGTRSIGALYMGPLFTASPAKVTVDWLVGSAGMEEGLAQSLVRNVALGLVAIVMLVWSVRVFLRGPATTPYKRQALVTETLKAFYETMFAYLAFATFWFQPWYLIWLVALTAPLARYTYANRTLLFCIGGIGNYFVWDFVWLWDRTPVVNTQIMAAIVVYTLPLFYTLYTWLTHLRISPEPDAQSEIRNSKFAI